MLILKRIRWNDFDTEWSSHNKFWGKKTRADNVKFINPVLKEF